MGNSELYVDTSILFRSVITEPVELGHQLSGQATHAHGTSLRPPPAAASRYVQKTRGSRARVVRWDREVRVVRRGLGRNAQTRVNTLMQQRENQRTVDTAQHLLLLLHNSYCCCAVPSLLLKPGNTFDPGLRKAGRGAGPPNDRYRRRSHRGNCVIHASSVETMGIILAAVECWCTVWAIARVLLGCSQLIVVPIRVFVQETKTRIIGLVLFRPTINRQIFHACVPRISKTSQYLTV